MNKRALYESIMNTISKQVKNALLEYRTKTTETYEVNINDVQKYLKTSIQQWILDKFKKIPRIYHGFYDNWGNGAIYLHFGDAVDKQPITVTITNRIHYYDIRNDLENIVEYMKDCKEFKLKAASIARKERLEYQYFPNKDEELYNKLTAAKNQFEADVAAVDTDEFAPTKRDWEKMIGYMNNHSNPEQVAKSCKDHNKIVARYIIAKSLGWAEAAYRFKLKIKNEHILNEIQLEAYTRKYATNNIPEEYAELIQDYKDFDSTGGLNQSENSKLLPNILKKYIHEVSDIKSYTIEIPEGKETIPVKKPGRSRIGHSSSPDWTIGSARCAILHFTLINGKQKDLIFVSYAGECAILDRNINGLNYVYTDTFEDTNPKIVVRDIKYYLGLEKRY